MKNIKNKLLNLRTCFKTGFLEKWRNNFIYLGVMRAYSIPALPERVERYYNNIFVIIFRFTGGLSLLMVVTNTNFYLQLPKILQILCVIVASIHVTQVFIISTIKTFYCLYILRYKREKFK
jgi:hypothetical protein